jgi:two-component system sensor histidine kinase MprB
VPLRRRVAYAAAAAVAVAIVLACAISYMVVRGQLRGQVDNELNAQAQLVVQKGAVAFGGGVASLPPNAGGPAPYGQIVSSTGVAFETWGGHLQLPADSTTLAVAAGTSPTALRDVTVGGNHLRVITFQVDSNVGPVAVQLARPLGSIDTILSHLRLILVVLAAGGVALAAALGRIAARRVLAPLAEVAQTVQEIGETDDLSRRLRIHADDEVGQLADRFNTMLARLEASRAALDESVRAQRQLVADASHELRTPVTSLRTNVEVLLAADAQLDDEERRRLLSDVVEQSEELTTLVGDLIELARGDQPYGATDVVRLDRVAAESLEWARRNFSNVHFEGQLEAMTVAGVPERLERAINNLLDNAARHSPPGGLVELTVDGEGVRVHDHGRGVDEQDLPYVFDRFYRGASSRGRQGSGLGLAIVRQVAEQHGGSATVVNAPGGGALFTLHLPVGPAEADADTFEDSAVVPAVPGARS